MEEIKLGLPQNPRYGNIIEEINTLIEELNQLQNELPKTTEFPDNQIIKHENWISEHHQSLRDFDNKLHPVLKNAVDFYGNPKMDFKKDCNVTLSYFHYSNLLKMRIDHLENSYRQYVDDIHRVEDYINNHNNKRWARKSIKLGWRSIILGSISILIGLGSIVFAFWIQFCST